MQNKEWASSVSISSLPALDTVFFAIKNKSGERLYSTAMSFAPQYNKAIAVYEKQMKRNNKFVELSTGDEEYLAYAVPLLIAGGFDKEAKAVSDLLTQGRGLGFDRD